MRIKALFIAGIVGVAVVAGVVQALSYPRRREKGAEHKGEISLEELLGGGQDTFCR